MSNSHEEVPQPGLSNYALSVIGALSSLCLFLIIVGLAYIPNMPESVNAEIVEARKKTRGEVEAKQLDLAKSYSWVNEKDGIVRIPLERAKQIAVEKLKEGN